MAPHKREFSRINANRTHPLCSDSKCEGRTSSLDADSSAGPCRNSTSCPCSTRPDLPGRNPCRFAKIPMHRMIRVYWIFQTLLQDIGGVQNKVRKQAKTGKDCKLVKNCQARQATSKECRSTTYNIISNAIQTVTNF